MTDPRFDIWNVLHDGEITVVAREEPDSLIMFVDIPYLRQRIAPLGDSFRLRLGGFRSIGFSNDIGDSYSAITDIAESRLEILSTESEAMPVKIAVAQGTLTIDFDSVDITLDTGQPVTYEQLHRVCEEYWNEWSAKHQQV
jgi:hypothetical protein